MEKPCSMEDCYTKAFCRGYCHKHYMRWLKFGDPTIRTKRTYPGDGRSKHPYYSVWHAMVYRCTKPDYHHYRDYGGRGIMVCDEWKEDFWQFVEDMGERPDGYTIERIDNTGNYEPSNCKWSSYEEQANNRRPRTNICAQCHKQYFENDGSYVD